jgi:hypothetical protein
MKTKVYTLPLNKLQALDTKVVFFATLTILIAIFSLYVYLVNKTIMNVVAREQTQQTMSSLSTVIGGLEFKYMTLKNSVTLDLAHAKGFQDFTPTTFLAEQKSAATLSFNTSR